MEQKSKKIGTALVCLFWLSFISCCILTGVYLISYLVQLCTHNYSLKIMDDDFSPLLQYGPVTYHAFMILNLLFWVLVSIMFYHLLQLFRLFKVVDPFHKELSKILIKIARFSLYSAYVAIVLTIVCQLAEKVNFKMRDDPYDPIFFLLLAAILYLVATVFQKGEALQTENELTV